MADLMGGESEWNEGYSIREEGSGRWFMGRDLEGPWFGALRFAAMWRDQADAEAEVDRLRESGRIAPGGEYSIVPTRFTDGRTVMA